MKSRIPFNLENLKSSDSTDCFICNFLEGRAGYAHTEVFQTDAVTVFLDKYPTIFGRVLVAPKYHLEEVTGDFSLDSYLDIQSIIYWVAEGVRSVLNPERVYVLSLGSKAANSHVHWHIVPLPEGVELEHQQFYALMHENGAIQVSADEQEEYAHDLRAFLLDHIGA